MNERYDHRSYEEISICRGGSEAKNSVNKKAGGCRNHGKTN